MLEKFTVSGFIPDVGSAVKAASAEGNNKTETVSVAIHPLVESVTVSVYKPGWFTIAVIVESPETIFPFVVVQ